MIKKFEEYINEGLWSSGMKRAETGEVRLGDKTFFDNYLKDVEWVDMGHPDVLFAKYDYPIEVERITDSELVLSVNMINDIIKPNLPKDVSIMNRKQIEFIKRTCSIKGDEKYKKHASKNHSNKLIATNENGDVIYFNLFNKFAFTTNRTYYYMGYKKAGSSIKYPQIQIATLELGGKPTPLGRTCWSYELDMNKKIYFIKLVKLK